VGSSLEGSNSDIGDEFTKLIVTQQAYSANTKVITTSNQMVQDLLNTLR
jgi:flagellar hook protein FlgE